MITIEILIPLFSNDGDEFVVGHHTAFEAEIIATFGGFSVLPGVVLGGWESEGIVYLDKTRVYVVAVTSLVVEGEKVVRLVEFAKVHYDQKAIFIRYLGMAEIL